VAKRSPILGYNHNVRYRGLVFHVQTEDSGLLNPHLFTHLFHGGVIVSTRKLVYDSGANEEAIKSLMQAQHKAVMKELRKGAFDEKIDQYLGGTPGLEPSSAPPSAKKERANTDVDATARAAEAAEDTPQPEAAPQPVEIEPQTAPSSGVPTLEVGPPESVPILLTTAKSRTQTADRVSSTPRAATPPPPPQDFDGPTLRNKEGVASGHAANHGAGPRMATPAVPVPVVARTASTPRPMPMPPVPHKHVPEDFRIDSNPEIEISVSEDRSDRVRVTRDTQVEVPFDPTVPNAAPDLGKRAQPGARRPPTGERPASLVGATLPPAPKPAQRPAFTPPQAMARPAPAPEGRSRDVDSVELYVEPGERPDRPGQYSMGRQQSDKVPVLREKGRAKASVPARIEPQPRAQAQAPSRSATPSRPPPNRAIQTPAIGSPVVRPEPPVVRFEQGNASAKQGQRQAGAAARQAPNNVVMTRPAVVVGAPPKPPNPSARVRKAREDEGHGFGQGLISEKSLDEVILAYLSEDAEDK
jgi:hypothetical protein